MADLKLYSRDETELQQELTIVKIFSNDIRMEFGLDKCATAVFKHGKLIQSQNISLINHTVRGNMELDETCKYLGTEEGDGTDNSQMKEKLVREYYCWVWQILKTELNLKNKITAINSSAVLVLVHSFRIVNWLKEIEKIDQKMRKLLTTEGIHHLMADNNRLYIKRQDCGCGLVKLESTYNAAIILSEYIKQGKDRLTRLM